MLSIDKGKNMLQNTDIERMKKIQHIFNLNLTAFTQNNQQRKLKLQ